MSTTETTTSYRWDPAQSMISRIDVRRQSDGRAVAYLYANPDPALQAKRLEIRSAIRLKGWGTLSDHRDGAFVLRVTGLRDGAELLSMLEGKGITGPSPQVQTTQEGIAAAPQGFWQNVRSNSLRWSGIFATAGNALAISSGIHRSRVAGSADWGQIGKGLFFSVADLPLMIAGGRDDSRQLITLLSQLKKHYEKEGIEIPSTASIHVETSSQGKSLGDRSMDFLHRYANQIKCSFEVLAAGMGIWAGKKQRSKFKEMSPYFWGSGFLASLLIPERKIDPDAYVQAGPLGRLWMKIQSNPLSIGGALGYTNNIGDYLSANAEKRDWLAKGGTGPQLYRWDRVTPTVMLGANGLYFMSKKTVGGDIRSEAMVADAYTVASQIINKQPEELREKAIESTARFFGARTEIKEHYPQVVERLRKETQIQRENPWFEPPGLAPYQPAPRRMIRDAVPAGAEATLSVATSDPSQTPGTRIAAPAIERQTALTTALAGNEIG